ncbi:HEAT repeat domain-containing protein [Halomicrobium salinisoli]|uniref:HEAT repeat domain-containing protein n=1 Tax=Halomicrobium salinisoli TaxID=2878391 RepID=UPI001CEFCC9F|nr:HEAT repeat domain-containing protein [Halomicrobium salinisoli]
MSTDAADPLEGVDTDSVTPDEVDGEEIEDALASSNPMTRQRGVEVCETFAESDVDAVRPYLDAVATLVNDGNAAIALRAISVLDAVADAEPAALEGRTASLAAVADHDIVDVQLTAGVALGKVVVERADLVAPFVERLIAGIRETELSGGIPEVPDVVDHEATKQTIREHEEQERERRLSARRTLSNVVVAVTQEAPDEAVDAVDDLLTLLDDRDPEVAGCAVDALGELADPHPEAVEPVLDELLECLDHDRSSVRARAIRALGRLGDDAAVPELRTMAEEDDEENVRELAAETADYLEDAA